MTDTTLEIDGNPGAFRISADADWDGWIAGVSISDCSHGGSIAMIEIGASGDDNAFVSTFTELTPGDVDNIIAVLTRIRETIEPEAAYLADNKEAN